MQAISTLINTIRTPIEQEHEAHGVDDQAQQQSTYKALLALAAA